MVMSYLPGFASSFSPPLFTCSISDLEDSEGKQKGGGDVLANFWGPDLGWLSTAIQRRVLLKTFKYSRFSVFGVHRIHTHVCTVQKRCFQTTDSISRICLTRHFPHRFRWNVIENAWSQNHQSLERSPEKIWYWVQKYSNLLKFGGVGM